MNYRTNDICILFDTPYVTYKKLPYAPSCQSCINCRYKQCIKQNVRKRCKVFVDSKNRFYVNGYEYKNGEWKRTLKALWYLLF